MIFTATQIILIVAALYYVFLAVSFNTHTLRAALLYQFVPAVLAFILGLMAFKVI